MCNTKQAIIEYLTQMASQAPHPGRLEVKLSGIDPLIILKNNRLQTHTLYWHNRERDFEIAGIGIADQVSIDQSNKSWQTQIQNKAKKWPNIKYFGALPFSSRSGKSTLWHEFRNPVFTLPILEFYIENKTAYMAINQDKNNDMSKSIALARHWIDQMHFKAKVTPDQRDLKCLSRVDTPNQKDWHNLIQNTQVSIQKSPLKKAVLSRQSTFNFNQTLCPYTMLYKIRDVEPNTFLFGMSPSQETSFIGGTPERLFKLNGSTLETEALAGSIQRGPTKNLDNQLAEKLLRSQKNIDEHGFVISRIQDVLGPLCKEIKEDTHPQIKKLAHIQHLIYRFKATIKKNTHIQELLTQLHPTPAVAGTPTKEAIQHILDNEPHDRGQYAGPIGWIGNNTAEFAVAIRSGLIQSNSIHLFSGAGIVANSTPEEEWNEIETKISLFKQLFTNPETVYKC